MSEVGQFRRANSRCEIGAMKCLRGLNCGVLKRLKNSDRNCRLAPSCSGTVLNTEKSIFFVPGTMPSATPSELEPESTENGIPSLSVSWINHLFDLTTYGVERRAERNLSRSPTIPIQIRLVSLPIRRRPLRRAESHAKPFAARLEIQPMKLCRSPDLQWHWGCLRQRQ
jgi:hypothetical protein